MSEYVTLQSFLAHLCAEPCKSQNWYAFRASLTGEKDSLTRVGSNSKTGKATFYLKCGYTKERKGETVWKMT